MLKFYIFIAFLTLVSSSSFAQTGADGGVSPDNKQALTTEESIEDAKQKKELKPAGDVIVEKYTDTDGNVQYRKYRYGFQYDKKTVITDKPTGDIQYKTYTNPDGTNSKEAYSWGFQYKDNNDSTKVTTPVKPKAPKFQTIKRTPIAVSGTSPQTTTSSQEQGKAVNSGKIDTKPENIQKTIEDMIKKSQQPIQ